MDEDNPFAPVQPYSLLDALENNPHGYGPSAFAPLDQIKPKSKPDEARSYNPSLSERMSAAIMGDNPSPEWRRFGENAPLVAGAMSPLVGGTLALDELSRAQTEEQRRGILIGLLGVKNMGGAVRRGAPHPEWGTEASLAKAQQAVADGVHPDIVFQQHGWAKNAYGRETPEWYTAIDDTQLKLQPDYFTKNKNGIEQNFYPIRSGDAIDHPDLFAAHPSLAEIPVRPNQIRSDPDIGRGSDMRTVNASIGIEDANKPIKSLAAMGANKEQLESLLTHELTHGAAVKAGLPFGSSFSGGSMANYSFKSQTGRAAMDRLKRDSDGQNIGETFPSGLPKDMSYREHPEAYYAYEDAKRIGNAERYYNDPGEVIARGEQELRDMMLRNPKVGIDTPRQFSHIEPFDLRHHFPQDGNAWDMRPYKIEPPFTSD